MAALNGVRLRQARELARLTQTQLAEDVGVVQPTIARAEQGLLQVSENVIETIALRTGFPVGWFFESSRLQIPEGSLLLYRRKSRLKSQERSYVLSLAQLSLTLIERLERRFRRIPSALPALEDVDYKSGAQLTRSALGLDSSSPVPNLLHRLESSGVVCVAIPCKGNDDFDAFSVRIDRRPFIFLNPFRPPDRIRLTVAHELDHLSRRNPLYGDLKTVERESFRFAAEFLMPEDALLSEIKAPVTLSRLAELKLRWGVALSALVRRARDLGIIEDYQYKYLNIKIRNLGWRVKEPGSDRLSPERPRALRKMVELIHGSNLKELAASVNAPFSLVESIVLAHAGRTDLPMKRSRPADQEGRVIDFQAVRSSR